jgi:hypothetical protein
LERDPAAMSAAPVTATVRSRNTGYCPPDMHSQYSLLKSGDAIQAIKR